MLWILALSALTCAPPEIMSSFAITPSRPYQVGALPLDVTITAADASGNPIPYCGTAQVSGLVDASDNTPITAISGFQGGKLTLKGVRADAPTVEVWVSRAPPSNDTDAASFEQASIRGTWAPQSLRQLPGYLSIIPPLIAVIFAILFRQAILALFAGIWIGACFIHEFDPLTALLRCFDTYLPQTLVNSDHSAIILFSLALGGMVGVIGKSGGTKALVDFIATRAKSRRSGLLTAWLSGLVVFFDDYANCLLVGNAVRPFTDRLRISREKLSYIVDSTASPIATVAVVSTWIGFQAGLLDDVLSATDSASGTSGYDLFLSAIPYSFYSLFTLAFVAALAITVRDFGPMLAAERRAASDGLVVRPDGRPLMDRELAEMAPENPERASAAFAIVPIASLIAIVAIGLYVSGYRSLGAAAADASLREIIADANSYAVLLWASFGAGAIAFIITAARRAITISQAMDAWISGAKAMTMAMAILVLAWALGSMCKDQLQTGAWVLSQLSPSPHWLPLMTFVLSGIIALTTGSSFSTMAIVIPIAGPMAWALTGESAGLDIATVESIRYATVAAVLSGAVFGDHCSPISDTTVMASMASAADHVDHVKTQTPYAILCATVAAVFGFIPAGYGISPAITLPLGIAVLVVLLFVLGRRAEP